MIPRVTDILLQQDLEGAEYVLRGDAAIDARANETEEQAITLLALQAPVAGDLRQTAAVLKLAPEIERSADLCCNICKAARRIYGHELDPKLRGIIQRMSDQAQKEYKEVVEAYLATDAVRAAAIRDMDDYSTTSNGCSSRRSSRRMPAVVSTSRSQSSSPSSPGSTSDLEIMP